MVARTLVTVAGIAGTQITYAPHLAVIIERNGPVQVSGENVYVAWTVNKTGSDEVMFSVSTDAGSKNLLLTF